MFELLVSDAVRFAHLLAVAVGFGVAVETEAYMLKRRRTAISTGMLAGLEHRHRVILLALGAMWVTGLALVALRTGFHISAFTPKLWAKITVVTLLSVNALFIAEIALPILAEHKGRPVSALPPQARRALFSVAGISATSWLIAFALGSSAILKPAPAPFFQTALPLAYILGILAANLVGQRLYPDLRRPVRATEKVPEPRAEATAKAHPAPAARQAAPVPSPTPRPREVQHEEATITRRAPKPQAELRASDLAIAFPRKLNDGPRLKPTPREVDPKRARAARALLAETAADLRASG